MVIVKIGSEDRPATNEDLVFFRADLLKCVKDKEELITHHDVVFEQNIRQGNNIRIYKLGSNEYPATIEDIEKFKKEVEVSEKEKRPIVWNHLVEVTQIDPQG